MSHYLITGGTGLIGTALCKKLRRENHSIIVLSRQSLNSVQARCGDVRAISSLSDIKNEQQIDNIINLAGAPIADRLWTEHRKKVLLESRVKFTQQLVHWLSQREQKPECLVSSSAIGWYGDNGNTLLTEQSQYHDEFTHQLCQQWEQQALKAQHVDMRVCILRTGVVLSNQGGLLKRILLPFKLGLGGRLGDGHQYLSWIHIQDLIGLISFLVEHKNASGIYNATAPEPVTNLTFTKILAKNLKRPAVLPAPALLLKAGLGEMSRLLLTGQRVLPQKAQAEGFQFYYTKLDSALSELLSKQN